MTTDKRLSMACWLALACACCSWLLLGAVIVMGGG